MPSCLVDETSFYRASQNPDGSVIYTPVGTENCGKAFAAGAIHSVLEDADVVTMFVGLSEIAKAALSSSVQTWMDYPGNLQSFQQKMETNPDAITPEDLARILPPSIQNEQKALHQVANMAQFLYKNYYTDANCWRSGELTAQVLPIVLTAGALAATKVAPLLSKVTGRLGRLAQALGSESLAQRLLNNSVEYIEVSANATKKVEQALIKNADGNIETIYEEVDDATTHQRQSVKICGACLAATTPLYGTSQTLADAQPQQPIQTLEADGSVGWRKVLKQKLKTNRRLVGSLNLTYLPTDKLNLLLSYSNFSSYSNLRSTYDYLRQVTPYNALDTLNFRQINQNLMVMGTLTLPASSPDINQSITLNGLLQRGNDSQGSVQTSSNLTNLSLDYTYQHNRRKLLLTTGFNFSHSDFSNLPSRQWGPSLSLSKTLSTHWKTSLSGLYTWGRTSGSSATQESLDTQEQSLNARWSLSGQLMPQLSLTSSLIYLSRQATSTDRYLPNFSELTATLGLSYQFSLRKQ